MMYYDKKDSNIKPFPERDVYKNMGRSPMMNEDEVLSKVHGYHTNSPEGATYTYFKLAKLSSKVFIFSTASASFFRSISMTLSGALFIKRSFDNLF